MVWDTFWANFSLAHLVTLLVTLLTEHKIKQVALFSYNLKVQFHFTYFIRILRLLRIYDHIWLHRLN
jgi:hypothetical protein